MVVEEEADMVVAVVAVMVSAQALVALCYARLNQRTTHRSGLYTLTRTV